MRRLIASFPVLFILASHTTAAYDPGTSKFTAATVEFNWHDGARDRDVPVKIYYPADAHGPCPVLFVKDVEPL